jgi:4-amino-4-deoxy-L-arabinose transferase-like glycosyltransferase
MELTQKRKSKLILVTVLIVSVILRLAAAIYLGDKVINLPGTFDQISYHNLALRLIGGYGFTFGENWWPATRAGEPTAHWSYLYTSYLAFMYFIFGPHPLTARIIQAIMVGILHPLLVYLIGKKVFGETAGLLGAGLTAIYIYFIYYAGTLMTEPFYITAILASIYFAIILVDPLSGEPQGKYRSFNAIGLGLSLVAIILLRQLFLLFIPFLFAWIWWAGYRKKIEHPFKPVWIASVVLILSIIPVTVFNYKKFDRFVLLNTNAGFAFFWGNNPVYGTKFVPILTEDMGTYHDLIPAELLSLNEAALDQALLRLGIQFVIDDPVRYILLSISRIPSYFMFWPSSDSGIISNISRVFSFGIMMPFMIYGLILGIIRLPKKLGDLFASPIILLIGFTILYTLIHLLTWTLIRYRLPVDAVLLIFAGLAIESIVRKTIEWRGMKQEAVPG